MRAAAYPILAALLPAWASAAEVTDLPPRWRGDVHVRYDGNVERVGLEESDKVWALRNVLRHDVGIAAEVAVWHGLAVRLGLPITASQQISYPLARQMLYDPISGEGSYSNGPRIENPNEIVGTGLQGVWIGLAAAPFREDYQRGLPFTSRIDLAIRTPGATLYDATRGASPGGVAVRMDAAFSVVRGPTNPYLRLGWQWEGGTTASVTNPDGSSGGEVEVQGGASVDAAAGVELVAWKNEAASSRFAVDLFLGVGYRGPERRPSGFWLPSVLPASVGLSVTQTEFLLVRGGAALDVHITRFVGLRLGGEGQWFTPHRIENPYAVRTDPASFGAAWNVAVVGRIRLKGDRL